MSDLYVDPQSGNDSTGNGSSGSPWKSLQKAIDNASGGDTIHMANTAADVLSSSIGWGSFGGGTSADAPLIITVWDNGGSLTISHPYANYDCWQLNGNGAVSTLFSTTSRPEYVYFVHGKLHSTTGKLIDAGHRWAALACELYDAGATAMWDTSGYVLIAGCYFHTFPASCIAYNGGSFSEIVGNYIDSPTGNAIVPYDNCIVHGNIIRNAANHGINAAGNYVSIRNNTIQGNGNTGYAGIRSDAASEQLMAVGNIIVDFAGSGHGINMSSGGNFRLYGHNHFHNNNTDKSGVVVKGLDLGGDLYGDPGFVDAAGGDFRIGTAGKAKSWPTGWPGSATLNFLDTGAAQRLEQSLIRSGMGGGMNG